MTDILALWRDGLPALLDGLLAGAALAGTCLLLGLPLGLGLALAGRSRRPWLRLPALALRTVGRGAPVLVLLQGAALGLPAAGLPVGRFAAAALALTWWAAAEAAAILGAGLAALPRGQTEAAAVLGLDGRDTLRFVLLPQGSRAALPGLIGLSILLVQATALGFAIGLPDAVGEALRLGVETDGTVPLLALAALLYLAVCLPATLAAAALARRLRRSAA